MSSKIFGPKMIKEYIENMLSKAAKEAAEKCTKNRRTYIYFRKSTREKPGDIRAFIDREVQLKEGWQLVTGQKVPHKEEEKIFEWLKKMCNGLPVLPYDED